MTESDSIRPAVRPKPCLLHRTSQTSGLKNKWENGYLKKKIWASSLTPAARGGLGDLPRAQLGFQHPKKKERHRLDCQYVSVVGLVDKL